MAHGSLLIFDLDGTLFHTETVTVSATSQAFEQLGLPVPPPEEICSFIGRTADAYNAWLASRCRPELTEQLIRTAAELELDMIATVGRLYPGVAEALAELRPLAERMAICSNGSRRYVEAVLHAHDVMQYFDVVRFRRPDDVSKPQMIAELLAELGGHSGGVLVGDRDDDINGAAANGLRAVGCAYGYGRDGELAGADAVASSATEVAALVRGLLEEASEER
ncbi:MAG: HAD family hydrolase, partial [Planctomycetota bacterium]